METYLRDLLDTKSWFILGGVILFLIADAAYVAYILKNKWRRSRFNPGSKKYNITKGFFFISPLPKKDRSQELEYRSQKEEHDT
ncbi:MAG: hypothetical protein GY868_11835 [Deltaproteobacteria bacterium]|nr:hypothetical protein [Deltaproteobacteria bacterium]